MALEKPRIAINYKIQTGPEDHVDQMCRRSIYKEGFWRRHLIPPFQGFIPNIIWHLY
jgi:hypothetical protein